MKSLILWRRAFWVFSFVAHLFLLAWILWVLQVAGRYELTQIFWHFMGLSTYGALLIVGTAKVTKYFHLQEWKLNHDRKH
jgi:hypothetical protein